MTTTAGTNYAKSAAENYLKETFVVVWSAAPCAGGSPWQNINILMPGGKERIEKHVELFRKLWQKPLNLLNGRAKDQEYWRFA